MAENARVSRSRAGRTRRTLDTAEPGDWIDRLCQADGPEQLAQYRDQAEEVAGLAGVPEDAVRR